LTEIGSLYNTQRRTAISIHSIIIITLLTTHQYPITTLGDTCIAIINYIT
jgi:hypothetical protein